MNRRYLTFARLGAVAALTIGVAGACGDDDGDAAEPTDTPVETAAPGTAAAPDTTPPDTAAPTSTPPATGGTTPVSASPEDAAEWQAVVDAAKAEGSLVLYTSTLAEPVVEAFEAAYPEIDVEIVRQASQELTPKIDSEVESGNVVGDVVWLTSVNWELDKADAGTHFAELTGPSVSLYPDDFVYGGVVAPTTGDVYGIMYNTTQVDEPAENTWTALLDEQYQGRVSVIEPNGATPSSYAKWLSGRENGNYLQMLADTVSPGITALSAPNAQAVAAGEYAWSPTVLGAFYQQMLASNAPVAWYVPDGDIYAVVYDTMVLQDSPHPNAAQLFADYLMSAEGQQAIIDGGHLFSWLNVYDPDSGITGTVQRDLSQVTTPQRGENFEEEMLATYNDLFR